MKLRWHTDFALRALMYLAFAKRKATVDEIAKAYQISKDHLLKVVQDLARHGYVRTSAGRRGGVELAKPAEQLDLGEIVARLEGRAGVLDCVSSPQVCPLEPGCKLRMVLIRAENAFYEELAGITIAQMAGTQENKELGGLHNLSWPNAQ